MLLFEYRSRFCTKTLVRRGATKFRAQEILCKSGGVLRGPHAVHRAPRSAAGAIWSYKVSEWKNRANHSRAGDAGSTALAALVRSETCVVVHGAALCV